MILPLLSLKMSGKQKTSDPHIWRLSSQPQTTFPGNTPRRVSRHMGAARVCGSPGLPGVFSAGSHTQDPRSLPSARFTPGACVPKSQNSAGIQSCQV